MTSTIVTLLVLILFLGFIFLKTKGGRKQPRLFRNDGQRKNFKDFQKEHSENDFQGVFGEKVMVHAVVNICNQDGRKFVLMRNLYIPSRGGTTEIDALLLHQSGIYVLESKNVAGEISGGINEEHWHQRLNARTEHTFHNPILQNEGHIRALLHFLKESCSKSELNMNEAPVFSTIIFSDRCVLKKIPAKGDTWNILHLFQLQERLTREIKNRKTFFDNQQLENLYWKLKPCMEVSKAVKDEHRRYVKSNYKANNYF